MYPSSNKFAAFFTMLLYVKDVFHANIEYHRHKQIVVTSTNSAKLLSTYSKLLCFKSNSLYTGYTEYCYTGISLITFTVDFGTN